MERILRPSRLAGWAQTAVTDSWNWLWVSQGPSHCIWQSHSRLLVLRMLGTEEKHKEVCELRVTALIVVDTSKLNITKHP